MKGDFPITPTKGSESAINPANSQAQAIEAAREQRTRIPMSIPQPKMTAVELPGFHCHWINDDGDRIYRAQAAGYSFVEKTETLTYVPDLAGQMQGEGTDLGSRVSMWAGTKKDDSPMRAYLMKIPNEFYHEDQQLHHDYVDRKLEGIYKGKQDRADGETQVDFDQRYVKSVSVKSTYSRSA